MSITTINYTYGIISNGLIPQESKWYRGYKLLLPPTNIQSNLFTSLWSNKSIDEVGCGTEMLIRLLRCSEYWPNYALSYDPVNTYDTLLEKSPDEQLNGLSWDELLRWSSSPLIPTSPDYQSQSSQVEGVISALFSTLVMKDGK